MKGAEGGARSIRGRVALVTGAASGMGLATARLFAAEGARVALTDIRGEEARAAAEEIGRAGHEARAWELDVSDAARVEEVVGEVEGSLGPIEILVNNAGVAAREPLESPGYEATWERTMRVNLTAHAGLIRACLRQLTGRGQGRVINVASTEGLGATAGISAYTASKHGVIGLTRALAVELGRRGVTVNCVCPGPIRTAMTAEISEEDKRKFARRRVPLGRYGEPEEVAHAILSLALPAASYIHGAVVVVDGGMTAQNT